MVLPFQLLWELGQQVSWAASPFTISVLAIADDGSFAQYMAELSTSVKYAMNIKLILLNNNELGKISKEQRVGNC